MRVQLRAAIPLSLCLAACEPSSRSQTSDPLGGVVYLSDSEPTSALGNGPLILTDMMIDGRAGEVFLARDAACKEKDVGNLFEWNEPAYNPTNPQSHHGMRLVVPVGKTLCFHVSKGQTKLVWAASRP